MNQTLWFVAMRYRLLFCMMVFHLFLLSVVIPAASDQWPRIVNATTVFWFAMFAVGLAAFDADMRGFDRPLVEIPAEWQEPMLVAN